MKKISTLVITAGLTLGFLSAAGHLESQTVRSGEREEDPPFVFLRIEGRRAAGSGELRVAPDPAGQRAGENETLALLTENRQRIEIRGSGSLAGAAGLAERLRMDGPALRLRYEQQIEPDRRRVHLTLLPQSEREPALLAHLDLAGDEPLRKEILPGLILIQKDEPNARPDVKGAAAWRTWLPVEIQGSESPLKLEGGETGTLSYRGNSYRLHVYRSLRRDPGKNPRLPFEGERYLLSATLTPP